MTARDLIKHARKVLSKPPEELHRSYKVVSVAFSCTQDEAGRFQVNYYATIGLIKCRHCGSVERYENFDAPTIAGLRNQITYYVTAPPEGPQ